MALQVCIFGLRLCLQEVWKDFAEVSTEPEKHHLPLLTNQTQWKQTAADCSEGQFRKLLILQNSMLETKLLLTLLRGLFWKQFAEMKDERHYRTKTWWGCGNAYLLTVKREQEVSAQG
jgi:hypothetical protein